MNLFKIKDLKKRLEELETANAALLAEKEVLQKQVEDLINEKEDSLLKVEEQAETIEIFQKEALEAKEEKSEAIAELEKEIVATEETADAKAAMTVASLGFSEEELPEQSEVTLSGKELFDKWMILKKEDSKEAKQFYKEHKAEIQRHVGYSAV